VTTSGPRPPRVALLSFRQPFAEALLDGRKQHEFRRGPAGFAPGDLLLVYETAPVSRVTGVARVGRVHRGSGRDLAGIEEHPDLSDLTADHLGEATDAVALQLAQTRQGDGDGDLKRVSPSRSARTAYTTS